VIIMNTPQHEARVRVMRLVVDLLRHVHHVYFSDMAFPDSVETTLIAAEIAIAQDKGTPFTARRLAAHLQMSRPTLLRRIAYLQQRGVLVRDQQALRFNADLTATSAARDAIRHSSQTIIDAAEDLSKMER
jgi:hypothetical protein